MILVVASVEDQCSPNMCFRVWDEAKATVCVNDESIATVHCLPQPHLTGGSGSATGEFDRGSQVRFTIDCESNILDLIIDNEPPLMWIRAIANVLSFFAPLRCIVWIDETIWQAANIARVSAGVIARFDEPRAIPVKIGHELELESISQARIALLGDFITHCG